MTQIVKTKLRRGSPAAEYKRIICDESLAFYRVSDWMSGDKSADVLQLSEVHDKIRDSRVPCLVPFNIDIVVLIIKSKCFP